MCVHLYRYSLKQIKEILSTFTVVEILIVHKEFVKYVCVLLHVFPFSSLSFVCSLSHFHQAIIREEYLV